MLGLMMERPLLISELIRHADRHHGATEIVSKTVEGAMHRYTYREAHKRARTEDANDLAALLFEEACILDGEVPDDPAAFATRLNRLVVRGLATT